MDKINKMDKILRKKIREKNSYGILCFRRNPETQRGEILMVQKRYTYSFMEFILGNYSPNNTARIMFLLNGMTMQEKINIMSLNFGYIWYLAWLINPDAPYRGCARDTNENNFFASSLDDNGHNSFFERKKRKFENAFLKDRGRHLRKLIQKSRHAKTLWEMPKGKKNHPQENEISCAVREFKEETTIPKQHYKILHELKPLLKSVTESNVRYNSKYFLAYYIFPHAHNFEKRLFTPPNNSFYEITDIKWLSLEDIKYLSSSLHDMVRPIMKKIRKYCTAQNANLWKPPRQKITKITKNKIPHINIPSRNNEEKTSKWNEIGRPRYRSLSYIYSRKPSHTLSHSDLDWDS